MDKFEEEKLAFRIMSLKSENENLRDEYVNQKAELERVKEERDELEGECREWEIESITIEKRLCKILGIKWHRDNKGLEYLCKEVEAELERVKGELVVAEVGWECSQNSIKYHIEQNEKLQSENAQLKAEKYELENRNYMECCEGFKRILMAQNTELTQRVGELEAELRDIKKGRQGNE